MQWHREVESGAPLQDAIKCFWYDRIELKDQSVFEVIPDGYAEIIFYFGGSCSIGHNGGFTALPSPFMVGLLNRPVTFKTEQRLEIVAVRCFPWTIFDLLNLPSEKGDVHTFEHPVAQLQITLQPLVSVGNIDAALDHVRQYFANSRAHVNVDSMLHKAGLALQKAGGSLAVSEVADAAHATVRTLERKFKQSSGHTVKDVSGLMRFEQVRNQLWIDPKANLAGLAHEFGYSDQAHLSREFKRYCGITPAAFARNAVKRKAAVDTFVSFTQS